MVISRSCRTLFLQVHLQVNVDFLLLLNARVARGLGFEQMALPTYLPERSRHDSIASLSLPAAFQTREVFQ